MVTTASLLAAPMFDSVSVWSRFGKLLGMPGQYHAPDNVPGAAVCAASTGAVVFVAGAEWARPATMPPTTSTSTTTMIGARRASLASLASLMRLRPPALDRRAGVGTPTGPPDLSPGCSCARSPAPPTHGTGALPHDDCGDPQRGLEQDEESRPERGAVSDADRRAIRQRERVGPVEGGGARELLAGGLGGPAAVGCFRPQQRAGGRL